MKLKILISSDGPHAMYFIRLGLARVFTYMGHEVIMWEIDKKPAHDAFDEFSPDIFLGQTYNLNRPVINAIKERPYMRVILKASDWGNLSDKLDRNKYPVLIANEEEIKNVISLYESTGRPDYLEIHYHPDSIKETHGHWIENGIPVYSQLSGADVFEYTRGKFNPDFESDITFIGGYWPYKAKVLDKYIIPLCKNPKYKIKIFGNSNWPVHQYCGFIEGRLTNDVLASATICPNMHEPHSQDLGYDIVERPFKLLSNKCFVISDYVEGLAKLFNREEMVFAKNPKEFFERVEHFLNNKDERLPYIQRGYEEVMKNHTYFNRVADIFKRLGYEGEAARCMKMYGEIKWLS